MRSELAARVAVSSFISVGTGFGNTGRVSPGVPVFQYVQWLDGSSCILWAGLRRTFHDVTNGVLYELEITLQLEYVVWESLFTNGSCNVGLITSE